MLVRFRVTMKLKIIDTIDIPRVGFRARLIQVFIFSKFLLYSGYSLIPLALLLNYLIAFSAAALTGLLPKTLITNEAMPANSAALLID